MPWTIAIATIMIILNLWHVGVSWLANKPGEFFTGIAHFLPDYFLYVSFMSQKTWIFVSHLFTNENLPPTWIYWPYTLLGKLGNPFLIYNLSIIIFSAVFFWLWWNILKKITSDRFTQIIGFLFLATASGISDADFWFSPTPALNRLGGVPHQILQTIFLLSMTMSQGIPLAVLSFFASITNPIQTLLLSLAMISTKPKTFFYLIPAIIGALLANAAFTKDPILASAKLWENSQHISVSLWQFVRAIGPIAVLIPFGVKHYLRDISPLRRIFLTYGLLSLAMFFSPLPDILGTSTVRWLSPAAYAVLPIIAAFAVPKKFAIHILLLYMFFTIPSISTQIKSRMNAPQELMHVPRSVITNMQNLRGDGVVLTDPRLPYDLLIPAFTGRKTFTGHPIHTLFPETKEELRRKFFMGFMTETEKTQFLKNHNITTIFP